MAARVIASIEPALDVLENKRRYREETRLDEVIAITVHKLRALRTFLLCSTILEEILLSSNVKTSSTLGSIFNNKTSSTLGSLLVRIESVVAKISVNQSSLREDYMRKLRKYLVRVESLEEELEQWYTSFSHYLLLSSSPASPDQTWDIANSVVENLNDFLVISDSGGGLLANLMKDLKEKITFMRNFIRFATLLCADRKREFCDLFTVHLAISSAHVTVLLFSAIHYNAEDLFMDVSEREVAILERKDPYLGLMSKVGGLLKHIKTIDVRLCWSYTFALKCFKNSRESRVSKLDLKNFTTFLLSTVWEMLQLDTAPVVSLKEQLQVLYEGLRFLTIALEKKLSGFVGKIRDITGLIAFDAGVIIFSLYEGDFAIDHGLQDFLKNIQVIRSEVLDVQTLKSNFPKTTILGFLEFLLDYLTDVRISSSHSDTIREHLVFFMEKLVEFRNQQEELYQAVWSLAVKIELLMDHLVLGSVLDSFPASIQSIEEDMMIIKEDFMKISDKGTQEITVQNSQIVPWTSTGQVHMKISDNGAQEITVQNSQIVPWTSTGQVHMKISDKGTQEITVQNPQIVPWTSTGQGPLRSSNPASDGVVGFGTERSLIIEQLERGSKNLQVVAIVGMPGSGKTTLAKMVYNDPSVRDHFHNRAWCSVSQVFDRKKIILDLLKQISPSEKFDLKTDDDLSVQLWRSLKGRRYLILIDDIWESQAFECLKVSFPEESNGSRFLVTSRNGEVARQAILDNKLHHLRQLTESESLGLLQKKLFAGNDWPPSLHDFGLEVAQYCKGLPLTIVIVAGILANARQEAWKGVLESLRSDTITTLTDECINSIELSYKHLPHHLKPCFLSFGAFPEDHLVSVKQLIWQWIAEGFVRKSDSERLEQVATSYLNILIGRSLVMKAEERSGGGVKECRMHDLLHDFCLRKANEEWFLHVLKKEPLSFHEVGNLRRLCIHSGAEHFKESKLFCPHLRSLSFFNAADKEKGHDMSFIFRISKHLRVLAMDQVGLTHLPSEIGFLVQLRYLAIHVDYQVSPSIGNLTNLETLFLCPKNRRTKLPDTFWNLKKLRNLFSSHFPPDIGTIELPSDNLDSSCNLVELDSLSALYISTPDIVEIQLRKFPNIRRLRFHVSGDDSLKVLSFPYLSQLESLSFQYSTLNSIELILPESLKKLSFLGCDLSGDFFSTIAELPNLEVLKVRHCNYSGKSWHVEDGKFSKLKHLVLIGLKIVKWTSDSDEQLPNLEKLVLIGCDQLVEIPECLENAPGLKMVEVGRWQPGCIADLVKKVEERQKEECQNLDLDVRVRNIGTWDVSEDVEVSDKEEEKFGTDVTEDVEVSDVKEETSWWKKIRKRLLPCWCIFFCLAFFLFMFAS